MNANITQLCHKNDLQLKNQKCDIKQCGFLQISPEVFTFLKVFSINNKQCYQNKFNKLILKEIVMKQVIDPPKYFIIPLNEIMLKQNQMINSKWDLKFIQNQKQDFNSFDLKKLKHENKEIVLTSQVFNFKSIPQTFQLNQSIKNRIQILFRLNTIGKNKNNKLLGVGIMDWINYRNQILGKQTNIEELQNYNQSTSLISNENLNNNQQLKQTNTQQLGILQDSNWERIKFQRNGQLCQTNDEKLHSKNYSKRYMFVQIESGVRCEIVNCKEIDLDKPEYYQNFIGFEEDQKNQE